MSFSLNAWKQVKAYFFANCDVIRNVHVCASFHTSHPVFISSVDLNVVNADKVIPASRNDELDHYEGGWLSYSDLFLLHLAIHSRDLLGLSNDLESISISSCAPFQLYLLHIGWQEWDITHGSCLLKLYCDFLGEQSRGHPELTWLAIVYKQHS